MLPSDQLLNQELRRDEGVRYSPYKCSAGKDTVGVGHNLEANPLPEGTTYPLNDNQVDAILTSDIEFVFRALDRHLPWWTTLTPARQRVLANMCFNLGINGLLTFKNTLTAIRDGKYELASVNMLASKWAKQTGARARRLAQMMVTG